MGLICPEKMQFLTFKMAAIPQGRGCLRSNSWVPFTPSKVPTKFCWNNQYTLREKWKNVIFFNLNDHHFAEYRAIRQKFCTAIQDHPRVSHFHVEPNHQNYISSDHDENHSNYYPASHWQQRLCRPMCTNMGNTQSKASSYAGMYWIELLCEHCQYRGLYKNVATWPYKIDQGHPYVKSSTTLCWVSFH